MKFVAAIICLGLSLASLFLALDASGSLQDAPLLSGHTAHTLLYALGCAAFGITSVALFVSQARRGL